MIDILLEIATERKYAKASMVAAPRCSSYDDECVDVTSPSKCWIGDNKTGPADGYCPLMGRSND